MFIVELAKAYNDIRNDLLNNQGRHCYKFFNYELDWTKEATHADEFNDNYLYGVNKL